MFLAGSLAPLSYFHIPTSYNCLSGSMTSPSTSTPSRAETRFALALLCLVLVVNAVALSAETWASRTPGNDNVSHLSLISGMVSAIEHHLNPLDFWSPEASFGSAPIRTYQPLAHLLVTAVYFAFGKAIPLSTVFAWFAYLAIVLLPAAFFAAARLLELPPLTAAAAALLAPLLSTNASYGLDYSSYVTTGRGLFPQSVATLLLLLALGYGFRALRHGTHGILAGLLLGLTCVCHFIYGWIGAVTLLLLLTVATPGMAHALRIRRLVTIGATAFLIAVFQLMPVFADGPILNHSRWEPAWKWDSFGAGAVLKALFSGEVLDYDRLPLLSLLALAGTLLVAWNFYRTRHLSATEWFVAAGALLWLLLYCGRPTWGRLLDLLGVTADFHLHRLIGAVQIFLVLLAAIALAAAWRSLASRGWAVAALLGTIVILAPMLVERSRYLAIDESSATLVRIAVDGDRPVIDATISELTRTGGRTYAGSGLSWGARFQTANIPFFAFLYLAHVPQASVSYHPAALTFDLLPVFDERNPAHYRLFNVRSVVAPAALTGQMASGRASILATTASSMLRARDTSKLSMLPRPSPSTSAASTT